MPFSFSAPGVITGSGNGSVGHLGFLHAKKKEINVNTRNSNSLVVVSLPLVLGNHQDLNGISSKDKLRLRIKSSLYSHPGRMAMEQRTTNAVSKK